MSSPADGQVRFITPVTYLPTIFLPHAAVSMFLDWSTDAQLGLRPYPPRTFCSAALSLTSSLTCAATVPPSTSFSPSVLLPLVEPGFVLSPCALATYSPPRALRLSLDRLSSFPNVPDPVPIYPPAYTLHVCAFTTRSSLHIRLGTFPFPLINIHDSLLLESSYIMATRDNYYLGRAKSPSPGASQSSNFFPAGQGGRFTLPPLPTTSPTSHFAGPSPYLDFQRSLS